MAITSKTYLSLYMSNYLLKTGQIDSEGNKITTNSEASGRFHTNWLNMMYPRLRLSRNLLSEDGAIFISIDKQEHTNLKLICDEIFGDNNFIGDIIWRSSDNSNNNALTFSEDHNYILVYSKQPDWRPHFLNDMNKRKHFKNPDNDPRGPWFDGNPVNNPGLRTNLQYDITTPSGNIIKHPQNGWRWSKDTMEEKFKTGELRFSEDETRVIRRTYVNELEGLPPSSMWIDFDTTGHTRKAKYELKNLFPEIPVTSLFSTPKPTLLIDYILQLASNEDSVILDFFSGSATTAQATMQRNIDDGGKRKFIMVQIPEECNNDEDKYINICEIGKERIRRVGDKILKENNDKINIKKLDTGFKVMKLASSNIKKWNPDYDNLNQSFDDMLENFIPNRTEEDVVYEIMLKYGIDLTYPVEERVIIGKKVFSIGFGALIICLDDNISLDAINGIVGIKEELSPEVCRVVFKDNGFATDSVKTNAIQILRRNNIHEVMSI